MGKKKDRLVPIRVLGKEDTKPRQTCRLSLLKERATSYPEGIEWFNQPACAWVKIGGG